MAVDSTTVAVVTGSTRGIGRAIAAALVGEGARVVVSGRNADGVSAAAADLSDGPGEAFGIAADVRDPEDCRRLIDGAVERYGSLDVLVNNAGVGVFAPIQELTPADWDRQIRTNLDGAFHCSKAAVPCLIAGGGGWIVNIGSLAGKNAFAGGVAYNASKWGLLGMTEAMMLDLRHQGIRVTCVLPGSVSTGFTGEAPSAGAEWKLTPEDVAQAVLDLLEFPSRALPSRLEIRPTRPPRK